MGSSHRIASTIPDNSCNSLFTFHFERRNAECRTGEPSWNHINDVEALNNLTEVHFQSPFNGPADEGLEAGKGRKSPEKRQPI
jgi:hypothetical protein